MTLQDIEWKKVDSKVVDFVFHQAEKHLDAQLQSGIASDARAVSAASILVGLSGVIVAASLGYWVVKPEITILLSGLVSGFLFLLAAYQCFRAAKPIDFYFPGNQPNEWASCLSDPLKKSKGVEIENYQEMIAENHTALDRAADYLILGMRIAIATPFLSVLVYFAAIWLSCRV